MPILANEKVVPGINPQEVSTWLFEMSLGKPWLNTVSRDGSLILVLPLEESGKLMDLADVRTVHHSNSSP